MREVVFSRSVCRIVSMILHPAVVPTIAVALLLFGPTILYPLSLPAKGILVGVVAIDTLLLPLGAIGILQGTGVITDRSPAGAQTADYTHSHCGPVLRIVHLVPVENFIRLHRHAVHHRRIVLCGCSRHHYAVLENQPPHDLHRRSARHALLDVCHRIGKPPICPDHFSDFSRYSGRCPAPDGKPYSTANHGQAFCWDFCLPPDSYSSFNILGLSRTKKTG